MHLIVKRGVALGVFILALGAAAFAAIWWLKPRPEPKPPRAAATLPQFCRDRDFEGVGYVICEIDTREYALELFHADGGGKAFGSLKAFDAAMVGRGRRPLLSMNAGMYHEDLSPVGLLVEQGVQVSPITLADGKGNFFMKPNGVFSIAKAGTVAITESSVYAVAAPTVAFATQSGPMLVIDGELHKRFEENGSSRYIRNGIGIRDPHTLMLAISRKPVSFGSFGRLFRDALACPNALYFDGAISAMSNGKEMIVGGAHPVGPILAVFEKE